MEQFVNVIEVIGGVAGALLTLITFFGLISKKPKEVFRKAIREESTAANQPLVEKIDKLDERMTKAEGADLVMLRNAITNLYFQYKDEKKIPHYAKENWLYLYNEYKAKGGNSYIKSVTDQMKNEWEEI